jgi:hypothetical protein
MWLCGQIERSAGADSGTGFRPRGATELGQLPSPSPVLVRPTSLALPPRPPAPSAAQRTSPTDAHPAAAHDAGPAPAPAGPDPAHARIRPRLARPRARPRRRAHPADAGPQAQARAPVHRLLLGGQGSRRPRRHARGHRHRGHAPARDREPGDDPQLEAVLHQPPAAGADRARSHTHPRRRPRARGSGPLRLVLGLHRRRRSSTRQEAPARPRRGRLRLCQEACPARPHPLRVLAAQDMGQQPADRRRGGAPALAPNLRVCAAVCSHAPAQTKPLVPHDDKEGHYIIKAGDLIFDRCPYLLPWPPYPPPAR